jgi:hypothetical protein
MLEEPRRAPEATAGRRFFFRVRVTVLLAVLAAVIIYGVRDHWSRSARREWQRPLEIALVLLERGAVHPEALAAFQARIPALERALTREFMRHGGRYHPFRFHRFGPVSVREAPPAAAPDPGLFEPLRIAYELFRFARRSDRASGLAGSYDGKIYVVLSPPRSARRALVEGLGQAGGRIAVTALELSQDSVDFGLFVITHELLHLLGAGDRYAPDGTTILPDGLGDPERQPLYPQDSVEVMARGRVLEPGREVPPGNLDELRVGAKTAAEIGWRIAP